MPAKVSPKFQALKLLEGLGFLVADVEKHERYGNVTHDLFGCLDLLAIREYTTAGLQITSNSNVSARVKKMLAEPRLQNCLRAGWKIEVWGVRDRPAKDGSFALCRVFYLNSENGVVCEAGSDILDLVR